MMQHSANTPRLQKVKTRNNQILNYYTASNFSSSPNDFQPGQLAINQKYMNNIGIMNEVPISQYQRTSHLQIKNNNLEVKHFQNRRHQQQIFLKRPPYYNHINSNFQHTSQIRNSLEKKLNKDQRNVSDKYLRNTSPIYKSPVPSVSDKLECNIEQENAEFNNANLSINREYTINLCNQKFNLKPQKIQPNFLTHEEEKTLSNAADEIPLISNIQNEVTQKNTKLCNVEANDIKIKNKILDRNAEDENREVNLDNVNLDVHIKDVNEKAVKGTREKTPMCLINDLARFNKISFQYRLTSENGPAHCKRFTVTLKLGDEEYTAEGFKIKKAQHLAAKEAIEKTKYKHPVPKTSRNDDINVVKTNITPTVELNALAMKLGLQTYYVFDPNQIDFFEKKTSQNDTKKSNLKLTLQRFETARGTEQPTDDNCSSFVSNGKQIQPLNQRQSLFSKYQGHLPFQQCQNSHAPKMNSIVSTYFSAASPCKITLIVGTRKFEGIGRTLQQAKHNAASNALLVLKEQIDIENRESHNETTDDNDNKSPISLVFEIGIKRNLPVDFKVQREEGPAHMRTFITACMVGDIITEGEGSGKKNSKKKAAQKMLEELNKLPPVVSSASPIKKVKLKIASKKSVNTQTKAFNFVESKDETEQWNKNKKPNYETDSANPITKLLEWHQNKKEKEPVFKLISECGKENTRRKQFVMEVSSNNIVAHGVGHNKKMAKRDAARNFLISLNGNDQIRSISTDNNVPKGVNFSEGRENFKYSKSDCIHKKDEGVKCLETNNLQERKTESSEESSISKNISLKTLNHHMKDQLLYLANLLGFEVDFSDYPKGNHNEFLTIVMLSTNPPQICHGVGISSKESQEDAAKNALKILSEMGLNNAVKT